METVMKPQEQRSFWRAAQVRPLHPQTDDLKFVATPGGNTLMLVTPRDNKGEPLPEVAIPHD